MNQPNDDNLPTAFIREEKAVTPKREAAVELNVEEEDFFALEGAFTSIENSEEFKGLEGDIDRHTPPAETKASYVNEYGVRVRGAKRCQPLSDDDEIVFSINMGDE